MWLPSRRLLDRQDGGAFRPLQHRDDAGLFGIGSRASLYLAGRRAGLLHASLWLGSLRLSLRMGHWTRLAIAQQDRCTTASPRRRDALAGGALRLLREGGDQACGVR